MAAVPLDIEIRPAEPEEIEFVPDLEVLSESNRCACAASDDNPY